MVVLGTPWLNVMKLCRPRCVMLNYLRSLGGDDKGTF